MSISRNKQYIYDYCSLKKLSLAFVVSHINKYDYNLFPNKIKILS